LESKQPIKQFKLDFRKDLVCSDGKIVIYKKIKEGGFCSIPFNTDLIDSLALTGLFDEEEILFPRAISNDRKLVVSLVQQKTNKRAYYGPDDDDESPSRFGYKTMLKVFNNDKETNEVSINDIFAGQYRDIENVQLSPNNNLIALIYFIDNQHFECKIFKFTDKGECNYLCKFLHKYVYDGWGKCRFHSTFNSREDLYMVTVLSNQNTIFVLDINKQNLRKIPCTPSLCFDESFLICTTNQDLVYIYDKSNLLLCYNLSDNSAREPITVLDFVKDFGIVVFDDTIMVHYFTKVRVYVSTGVELCVLCPFKKTILQTFKIDFELECIEEQKIVLNWSGEEIFFCIADTESVEHAVFVFFFCEDKKKHLELKKLARRAVHSTYPLAHIQKLNLPFSIKALLGVA